MLFNSTDVSRRDILRLAASVGVSFAVPAMEPRAAESRGPERQKSMILLWMNGGPSQLETWDPHPGSPISHDEIKAIDTTLPGLKISNLFPQTAEQLGSMSVIRSLVSKEGDHERGTYYVKTGYRPDPTLVHPAVTAIVSHELPDSKVEIPMHVSLGESQRPARGGFLGDQLDAFKVYDPGNNIRNMKAFIRDERQQRRMSNLEVVSAAFGNGRTIPTTQTLHQDMIQRALRMMASDQLKAFEVDTEPESVVQAYGDSRFGRGCLVARRLIETGVRAIEVTLNGFDTHASNLTGHQTQAGQLDPAFATLIADLKERDLLDSTVVLCIGEFGRTPNINPAGGRDHWPTGFSCVLGGGGLRSGVVLGATDPTGENKDPENPIPVEDLYATIMTSLRVKHDFEYITPIGRPMAFCAGNPIAELLES